jgi:hypothetical protein
MTKELAIFETELQRKIAELSLSGVGVASIAECCNCSTEYVYSVLNSVKYAKYAYNSMAHRLISVGAPAAVEALIECVKDKTASRAARNSAADKLLHHAGIYVTEAGNIEKSPASMTQAELQERLQQLQSEAANRAQPSVIDNQAPSIDDLLT